LASTHPLGPPDHGWIFEVVGGLAFVGIAAYFVQATVRSRELSFGALAFIGCMAMSWQEFFGDWGSYLLYNPDFKQLPWGHTTWTAPSKPVAVVLAYGWFYAVLFPLMLWVLQRVRDARPSWSRTAAVVVVAAPVLYVWNFVSADGIATRLGWWSYVETFGPTLHQAGGDLPLLYPMAFFLLFAIVALWLIDDRDDHGRPRFERITRAADRPPGVARETRRAAAWVLVMNATYAVTLMGPLVALRLAFGPSSTIVP
jgi:hypothetical protein